MIASFAPVSTIDAGGGSDAEKRPTRFAASLARRDGVKNESVSPLASSAVALNSIGAQQRVGRDVPHLGRVLAARCQPPPHLRNAARDERPDMAAISSATASQPSSPPTFQVVIFRGVPRLVALPINTEERRRDVARSRGRKAAEIEHRRHAARRTNRCAPPLGAIPRLMRLVAPPYYAPPRPAPRCSLAADALAQHRRCAGPARRSQQ